MNDCAAEFFSAVAAAIKEAACTQEGRQIPLNAGVTAFHDAARKCAEAGRKVIYIGNGGSASIASHMSVDLWKNGGIKSQCFNDPSLLTCLANDLGYEHVFSTPVESFAESGDMVVAISSSGKSANIINAAQTALEKGCLLVTCSGFGPDNPLRKMGNLNFYVPSRIYGVVETAHSAICHAVVDCAISCRK
ncbi:MAG: SIS domain-containing protein [Elusimicrobiaceae bacterium]|nr:SIS domain-containing protein [Elusimicrobiaceae bacterium]